MWWMNLISSETTDPLVFWCALCILAGGVLDAYYLLMRANKPKTALSRDHLYSLSGPTRYGFFHDLIIHEMLREKDKATTEHNRKTQQHNTTRPRQLFFKEKTASGGIRTHDRPLARRSSYQLSYRGSSVGWARITYTIQSNQSNSSITNQINW